MRPLTEFGSGCPGIFSLTLSGFSFDRIEVPAGRHDQPIRNVEVRFMIEIHTVAFRGRARPILMRISLFQSRYERGLIELP